MSKIIAGMALVTGLVITPVSADAAGCLKGAVVGGVAGHYAHHHAILGAIAGCAIGHHMAAKREREKLQHEHMQQQQLHGNQGG
jgi:outer membrane lipoprotein SlyB